MSIIYFLIGCSVMLALVFCALFFGRKRMGSTMIFTPPRYGYYWRIKRMYPMKNDDRHFHSQPLSFRTLRYNLNFTTKTIPNKQLCNPKNFTTTTRSFATLA